MIHIEFLNKIWIPYLISNPCLRRLA